jgi:DNA replication protein DnaC
MLTLENFLITNEPKRFAGFEKTAYFKLIWQGIDPQPKDQKTCFTCKGEVKEVTTTSQLIGTFGFVPSKCEACRSKEWTDYKASQVSEEYKQDSRKCCGYQNKKVKHDNQYPHFEAITKNIKWQENVVDYITSVCANHQPKGLLLTGATGVGKTLLMKVLHNELIDLKMNTCFIKAVDLAIALRKETFGDEYKAVLSEFRNVETLIIDDYGTQKNTEWVKETMFSILDNRYENRKRTILTTNLSTDDLKAVEPRLHSRLLDRNWMNGYMVAGNDLRLLY